MAKTRVHILAKELGIEVKDFIAQLEKLGVKGKKSQSSLEDEEAVRIRAALAAPAKPQVVVGEEKVVADRVVTTEDENVGGIQAHEKIVERRVRTNVIRRRTSRTEVAAQTSSKLEVAEPPDKEAAPAEPVQPEPSPSELDWVSEPETPVGVTPPVEAAPVEE